MQGCRGRRGLNYHIRVLDSRISLVVIPTVFLDAYAMEDKEALERIGQLIVEAHRAKYPSRRQFSFASEMDVKTITSAERGERELHPNTQRKLEQFLGWRKGSIQDVWDNRAALDADAVTVAEMERGAEMNHAAPVSGTVPGNLSQFHTEEILGELMYRVRNYKSEIDRLNKVIALMSEEKRD